jgi:hypothetical protein
MIARYHSKCAKTGAAIRPGDTINFTVSRRPILVSRAQETVSDVFVFSGEDGSRAFYRNKNGRCEDAPCCGCCTI